MKKRIFTCVIILILVITVIAIVYLKKAEKEISVVEYEPQEEISDEQLRQTMVSLYFANNETGELMPEVRLIDVKTLIDNPYITLVNLLIEGPKNDNLKALIPSQTKINKAILQKDMVILDLSKEFIEEGKTEEEINKKIYSIVNTLTELTEVESVKFLIDGEENTLSIGNNITLKEPFVRMDKAT